MRKISLALGLAGLVFAGGAGAETPKIVEPDWLQKPNGEDIARVYPEIAQILNIEGRAMVACNVDAQGLLENCRSEAAAPAGLGFDYAALKVAEKFRMRPRMVDGAPVEGGGIRIPIRFTLPKGQATAVAATTKSTASRPAVEAAKDAVVASKLVDGFSEQQEKSFLRAQRASQAGADPVVLAEAFAALREARAEAAPLLTEATARNVAARLSLGEINQWLAYLKSPAASKFNDLSPALSAALESIRLAHVRWGTTKARSIFCGRHDCSVGSSLSGLNAMAEPSAQILESPRWSEYPTLSQTRRLHPFIPNILNISGWAVLRCRATALGLLENCAVVSEAPPGLGFGGAALSLSDRYRLAADQMPNAAGKSLLLPTTFVAAPDAPQPPRAPEPSSIQTLAWKVLQADGSVRRRIERDAEDGQRIVLNNRSPGIDDITRRDAGEALRGAMIDILAGILQADAAVYAGAFTEAELQERLAFLSSPAGALATGHDPEFEALMQQSFHEAWLSELEMAKARFCKARDCGPEAPAP